jgi:ABC-type glutathione transport system ATPase component
MTSKPLLNVENLIVEFGSFRALNNVSVDVGRGETVAVVGESGCGKTTLARTILGLQKKVAGRIQFDGPEARVLAEQIGMVWQDPYASLDPRWTIKKAIEEPARLARKTVDVGVLLEMVGLSRDMGDRFPHQLSGGQRQRAAIGRALALRPPLVICDEPTAALDLSIQAQILNLLGDLKKEIGCSILYISHDLETVRFIANRIVVMRKGEVVEQGDAAKVFANPAHPYTRKLMSSALTLDRLGELPPLEQVMADV